MMCSYDLKLANFIPPEKSLRLLYVNRCKKVLLSVYIQKTFEKKYWLLRKQLPQSMNWQVLENTTQLEQLKENPFALIFKHSTRCSISSAALDQLERKWKNEEMPSVSTYFLDLIRYREISNQIAEKFGVEHQSPQVLLLQNGKCIYHNSHFGIDYDEIKAFINK